MVVQRTPRNVLIVRTNPRQHVSRSRFFHPKQGDQESIEGISRFHKSLGTKHQASEHHGSQILTEKEVSIL